MDYSSIVAAADYGTAVTALAGVFAAVALVLVALKGGGFVLRTLNKG